MSAPPEIRVAPRADTPGGQSIFECWEALVDWSHSRRAHSIHGILTEACTVCVTGCTAACPRSGAARFRTP